MFSLVFFPYFQKVTGLAACCRSQSDKWLIWIRSRSRKSVEILLMTMVAEILAVRMLQRLGEGKI